MTAIGKAAARFGDRYEIVRTLGRGGMGVVYEVLDRQLGVRVALKTMQRLDAAALYRFKNEFRALTDVSHPNLIQLHELVADEERTFFTMELVEGKNFLEHVRRDDVHPVSVSQATLEAPRAPTSAEASGPTTVVTPLGGHRRERACDVVRIRAALRQLAEGVDALHATGRLHRDLKPSNVMVTREGRVVVLDFGLVSSLARSGDATVEQHIVGTPEYMSPEQAVGSELSEASDWYSVGVMLYEALTGARPFDGPPLKILLDKQQFDPTPPGEITADVPEDLAGICMALLRRTPSQRPRGSDLLAGASGETRAHASANPVTLTVPTVGSAFVGRERHARVLAQAYDDVVAGKTVAVLVRGSSGMGKSSLVKRFLDALGQAGDAVVLSGCCYERESVPFKALDSVIDALSRYLRRVPRAEAEAVLPREIHALTRVFPVLARVEAFTALPRRAVEVPDPQELQRRAFRALRELVARISDRRPLVIWIDDLQWGDVDSIGIFRELLRPGEAPSFLLIASFRSEEAETTALVKDLLAAKAEGKLDARDVEVGPLSREEATELALALLGRDDDAARAQAAQMAEESHGSPLFVDELVRFARSTEGLHSSASRVAPRLDDVLYERIAALPADARRLLEVVAVAGHPILREAARSASELAGETEATALAVLRAGRLVRTSRTQNRYELECFHDRVRGTVAGHLSPDTRAGIHRRLAFALVGAGNADPEALVVHFQEGGDAQRAGELAAIAAAKAVDALAFDRAAELWQKALDLQKLDGTEERTIRRNLGDALANAGRGAPAARAYRRAAEGANVTDALDLQRRAAEQLLRSGHFDEGIDAIRTVLGFVGLRLASTPFTALVTFLAGRLWMRIRGYGFRPRDSSSIAPSDLMRVDIIWSLAFGIALIDPIRGAAFQTRYLLATLRLGEVNRIARGLASEAAYSPMSGAAHWPRTQLIFKRCDELAPLVTMPDALGWIPGSKAFAHYCVARFRDALTFADEALRLFRDRCVGVQWEIDTAQSFALWSLANLGEIDELRRRQPIYAREAADRGDKYGLVLSCNADVALLWLADDDPDRVHREIDAAMHDWSKQGFHFEHFCELIARSHADLYAGHVVEARRRLDATWGALEGSMLLRFQSPRVQVLALRARASIALAEAGLGDTGAALRSARRDAKALEREGYVLSRAYGGLVRAGIASLERREGDVASHLSGAITELDRAEMKLHAAIARRVLGAVTGGPEATSRATEAEAWMRSQGVRDLDKMTRALVPGFSAKKGAGTR